MQQDGRLRGKIRKILPQKNYGFIRHKGIDYFFHRSAYQGDWQQLIEDASFSQEEPDIQVTFEIEQSDKGPRATNVERL